MAENEASDLNEVYTHWQCLTKTNESTIIRSTCKIEALTLSWVVAHYYYACVNPPPLLGGSALLQVFIAASV